MTPTNPIHHSFSFRNQQNKTKVLFYYSMLMYSGVEACFEHSNFFKVIIPSPLQREMTMALPVKATPMPKDQGYKVVEPKKPAQSLA